MFFWTWLWTILWFGGLGIFSLLAVVISLRGGRDLLALLKGLRNEADAAARLDAGERSGGLPSA